MTDTQVKTMEKNPAAQTQQGQQARRDDRAMLPRVDVLEDDTGITLLADLPGVSKDKLELKVEGDTLSVEGEVAQDTPESLEAVYAEVRIPRYRRAFTLSRELDTSRIEANLKDGVLNLRIPKVAEAQPRRIQIQVGWRAQGGDFRRDVKLPVPVQANKASARYRDGVLRIELPKQPGARPRRIAVQTR